MNAPADASTPASNTASAADNTAAGPDDAGAPASTAIHDLAPTLDRLRTGWLTHRPSIAQRREDLARLRRCFKDRIEEMAAAISADFGHRSREESLIADGMTVLAEIDHLRRHLRAWTRPRRVAAGWRLWPARAQLRHQPLGVIGVVAPWNYPINLALVPLATAIAAGNHVFLKPSEITPRTSAFLADLLAQVFPPERVAVAQGGAEVGQAFCALPFDHLVFTGSTVTGRKVAEAAARNLTPVTLELGGKSPAIVCADYPVDAAAARLATGKWFNAGQTCIAPDYVLIDRPRRFALVQALREQVTQRYGTVGADGDLAWIVNQQQFARLRDYLDDAAARGTEIIPLAETRGETGRLLPPTVLLDPPPEATVMQEEIFGPLLPVLCYDSLDEALAIVARQPRPLALYPFSHDRRALDRILGTVVAGGVTVNGTLLHFTATGLPFGGVGASGMGAYHARAGFDAMGHRMPVLWQPRWALSDRLKPPYTSIAGLLKLLLR
ncbi:coniferyl aldehyde dehydrogenase [Pseudoxanthomonas sp.]|uniref:coniferyl aldehyde dehydrogenase n=1 Tax=Pseudoxanthomonas sp. TaxID=1871049 RepID=UPI00261775FB|nr:coniferyl aldehyde dehydrogenase [Pseudoxanthomonas sp.]WDS35369.1 MAG: coniferyl aldehyde dehydrogenase [Pseudoxanthomonas sp.]